MRVSEALIAPSSWQDGYDHPLAILDFIIHAQSNGRRCALVTVTDTVGGSVRAPGAILAVDETGEMAGYVSNGCVDGDVATQSMAAIQAERPRLVRYGEDSPFMDIRLPCGGAIQLLITPSPDTNLLREAAKALRARRPVGLQLSERGPMRFVSPPSGPAWRGEKFETRWTPPLRLRIAGRGAEVLALTRLATAANLEVVVQSPDERCLRAADAFGALKTDLLTTPSAPPPVEDDPFTAFVLLFHDHDWELELLKSALEGDAFYIGALGGRKTHARRRAALSAAGLTDETIARVRGPIGLIPAMRDSGTLAISTLAEVVSVFRERCGAK